MAGTPRYVPQTNEGDKVKQNVAIQQLYKAVDGSLQAANNLSDLASAATARVNLGIDQPTYIGDVNYTILPTDSIVVVRTPLTAPRTLTLPFAVTVEARKRITITGANGGGTFSPTNPLTILCQGSDQLNPGNATSLALTDPGDRFELISDNVSRWSYVIWGIARGGTGAITAPAARTNLGAAGLTQTDDRSGIIKSPANQDYRIVEKLPVGCTLTSLTCKLASGTCTATLKINTTAVTGGAINATTTQQSSALTAANVANAGDALVITVSAAASAIDLSITLAYTRPLV